MSRQDSKQIENVKVMLLKGENGSNIESIAKTGTDGLVDTYTVTLSDGSKTTFTVTNGKSITSVEKTDTQGLVDTYTITFNDNSTITFVITNGNGITSVAKTGTQGLVDTYTITFDDGSTETFTVTNGANGQDVSQSNLAPVETGNTASQSYAVGQHLIWNGVYYKVIQAIAVGDAFNVGVNLQADSISIEIEQLEKPIYTKNTEEMVGYWDGKPLYRKALDTGFMYTGYTHSGSYYYDTLVIQTGIAKLISTPLFAIMKRSGYTGKQGANIPFDTKYATETNDKNLWYKYYENTGTLELIFRDTTLYTVDIHGFLYYTKSSD